MKASALILATLTIATATATAATTRTNKLQHSQHVVKFFETHSWLRAPRHENCASIPWQNQCRIARRVQKKGRKPLLRGSVGQAPADMGIDWMTWDELREAIPPAYTQFIGTQLLAHIGQVAA